MGSKALGICDRTGFRYPLKDLVWEVQNNKRTGLRVGKDVVDPDHPQNFLGRLRLTDPKPLRDARPENDRPFFTGFFGWRPVGHPEVVARAVAGAVTINTGA
jgi:hypothetical protein